MTKDRSCMTCTNSRNLPALRTPFMIGVAGGTASGKSTVCSTLVDKLGQSEVLISCLIIFNCLNLSDQVNECSNLVTNFALKEVDGRKFLILTKQVLTPAFPLVAIT